MPIEATPFAEAPLDEIACEPATLYGEPLNAKRPAAVAPGGGSATWRLVLRDAAGSPVDLLALGFAGGDAPDGTSGVGLQARFREALSYPDSATPTTVSVSDPAAGEVLVAVPAAVLDCPAVYVCEIAVVKDGRPVRPGSALLWVDPTSWDKHQGMLGLPPLESVRAAVSDDDLARNLLTEHRAYPLADLAEAAVRACRFWNETNPPVGRVTTASMPYRDLWLDGIKAFCFEAAEEWYRRNELQYDAGGTSVDDVKRLEQYHRARLEHLQSFTDRVRQAKVRLNIAGGFGIVGSGYMW